MNVLVAQQGPGGLSTSAHVLIAIGTVLTVAFILVMLRRNEVRSKYALLWTVVGLFLGGSNEGLLGVTYEVVGPPSAPVLRVNPISAVAPGLLRKFFEFPSGNSPAPQTQSYADPRN